MARGTSEVRMSTLSANDPISDVFCRAEGKEYVFRNEEFFRKELKLSEAFPPEALTKDAEIFCRLYNGELLPVDVR